MRWVRLVLLDMLEVTKISSKGQVVIPKAIRENLELKEGDKLIAYNRGDLIVLRRLEGEESILSYLSQPVRRKIAELGVARKDIDHAVKWAREKP